MFVALALAAVTCGGTPSRGPTSHRSAPTGEQILQRMHVRYAAHWFRTITFAQNMTVWDSTGKTTVLRSYYSIRVPGTMRSDFAPLSDGNGALTMHDSTLFVRHDSVAMRRAGANVLLALSFDVYGQPAPTTAAQVGSAGYDLSKVHQDTWQGEPVYVIGADSGDLGTLQVWVDVKRLLLVRLFTKPPTPNWPGLQDIRFLNWERIDGGMVAPRVQFFLAGKLQRQEDYSEIRANVVLRPELFDVRKWMTAPNWAKE